MRYFIHLGYDGGNYRGWQRQKDNHKTVQEVVEYALFKLFKKNVVAYGCGRTDAGVHASQYVIHINLDEAPLFDFKFRMNKNLPNDIAVFDIIEVKQNQHCRFDAVARTYDYFIHWKKDPVLFRYSTFYEHEALDFNIMKKATELIRANKDFKALCKSPDIYPSTICEITKCDLYINEEQGRMRFSITSNRFLRGMIRYCVFFIMEVGRGVISLEDFEQILNLEKTYTDKKPAHPNGLFLSKVEYPYLELEESHNLIKMLKLGLE